MSKQSAGLKDAPASEHVNQLAKNAGRSKAGKTFEAEDPQAVARATSSTNHPDYHGEAVSLPEAGTNKREKGSVRSAAGEGIPAKKASKNKLSGPAAKAQKYNERSQAGNADPTGGHGE